MPYETFWYVNHRVACLKLIGVFTIQEMYESAEILRDDFLAKADGTMHLICDLRSRVRSPHDLKAIIEAGNIYLRHPAMGWVVFIDMTNPIKNFLVTVTSQILKVNFKASATEEEARSLLVSLDPTLESVAFARR